MINSLALKPYLEAIQKYCEKHTADELMQIICKLAQDVPIEKRTNFLSKIQSSLEKNEDIIIETSKDVANRIKALKESVNERKESIENGSYYDDLEWDEYDNDEDPSGFSEEQKIDIETLFAEADDYFLNNNLKMAQEIYDPLIGWFCHNENDFMLSSLDKEISINWRETRARYCRCLYENSAKQEKVEKMIKALEINKDMFKYKYNPEEKDYPFLQDVIDTKVGELLDWQSFVQDFRLKLDGNNTNRAIALFFEATQILEGITGVINEVFKKRSPIGYLYLLDQLSKNKKWDEVSNVAKDALNNIPYGNLRKQSAEYLSIAGEKLNNNNLILQGKKEQFYSVVEDETFILLLEESVKQNVKEIELELVSTFLQKNYVKDKTSLKIKTFFMLKRLNDAFSLIKKNNSLGWSDNDNGIAIFVSGLMIALTKANSEAVTIQKLFKNYGVSMYGYGNKDNIALEQMKIGLKEVVFTESEKQKWLNYLKKIIGDRVDGIVSNHYRGAYDRAALALGALMECFIVNGGKVESSNLFEKYRNQKYSRFPSFRREIDSIVQLSPLLNI